MSNAVALVLALSITSVVLADLLFNGADALLFLARKFLALVEYLAVWR
ncbi:hypothetical protein JANAI62_22940 [Jannaschia pagri]|uniref:Glyceraldehyde-3-phosphate dehydrogenase n=1 Tax=Jannaschia pagri TaxID=2829797 RepID=A0ABQ4NMS8_9RHOB|nr:MULTISPECIES: hypothetical protein [unclassified Jannaschia]GIT91837.1 hypothetical protein JANAI61_22950 [Jannaschia sp. AI_61]GIT95671.1 hypothetical protein JANAI62_22940 [Jannaschia sp. AI_62]